MKRRDFCLCVVVLAVLLSGVKVIAQAPPVGSGYKGEVREDYKWRYCVNGGYSPAIGFDGIIYVAGVNLEANSYKPCLYAFNPTGSLKWRSDKRGIGSIPIVASNGRIILAADQRTLRLNRKENLSAFDANGNPVSGVSGIKPNLESSMGVDGTIYYTEENSRRVLDPEGAPCNEISATLVASGTDGALRWKCEIYRDTTIDMTVTLHATLPAIGGDGTIYVPVYGPVVDQEDIACLCAVSASGRLKWKYITKLEDVHDLGIYPASYPVVGSDGTIYFSCGVSGYNDYLYAVNPNGTLKWRKRDAKGDELLIGADGTIYLKSNYNIIAIAPDGKEKWTWEGEGVDEISGLAMSDDGVLYFTAPGRVYGPTFLYAVQTESPGLANSPWPKYRHDNQNSGKASAVKEPVDRTQVIPTELDQKPNNKERGHLVFGGEEWIARYNCPGNLGNMSANKVSAIAVDATGNVYITGDSHGVGTDYVTIKYNSSGQQQWVARYNGPGNDWDEPHSLALDASGNVFVTGESDGEGTWGDYATIKYNSSGQQQWVARYNGPGNSSDEAYAIALDASGNIYVTGESGKELDTFTSGYHTPEVDYATIKYNPSGQQQWVARYSGGSGYSGANSIALDASGNVYVTGNSDGEGTNRDYATIKYNPSGQQQWVARYNGPGNSFDNVTSIAIDASGNIYVTGMSIGTGTGLDYATIKYTPSGQEQWVARYNGKAEAIALDASGNIYVTGTSYGAETRDDYATIKYNSSGQQQWVALYNSPRDGADEASSIALDSSGNIYVTGTCYGLSTSLMTTIKYKQGSDQQ